MKKFLLFSFGLFAFGSLFLLPQRIYAHFPQTDGAITVTLHVDPNDDPIAGQQAHLFFLFDDATSKFDLSNCMCTVTISKQRKQIYKQQLTQENDGKPSIWGASIPYIFPTWDVYQITLRGIPKTDGIFQRFMLTWYFRVDSLQPGLVEQPHSDITVLIGATIGGIIFFILLGIFIKKEIIDSEVDNNKQYTYTKKRK